MPFTIYGAVGTAPSVIAGTGPVDADDAPGGASLNCSRRRFWSPTRDSNEASGLIMTVHAEYDVQCVDRGFHLPARPRPGSAGGTSPITAVAVIGDNAIDVREQRVDGIDERG